MSYTKSFIADTVNWWKYYNDVSLSAIKVPTILRRWSLCNSYLWLLIRDFHVLPRFLISCVFVSVLFSIVGLYAYCAYEYLTCVTFFFKLPLGVGVGCGM